MSVGGKKNDYDFQRDEDDLNWWAEQRFNIREVRMISSALDNYKTVWQGEPERPKEEMDFLNWYRAKIFSMISDYNFSHHEIEGDTTPSAEDT